VSSDARVASEWGGQVGASKKHNSWKSGGRGCSSPVGAVVAQVVGHVQDRDHRGAILAAVRGVEDAGDRLERR